METTREGAKKIAHDSTVQALNQLLEKNYDAENGYKNALIETKSAQLKSYFTKQAARRSQNANELYKAIRNLNATPVEKGSTTAAIHKTWLDLKTAIIGKNDEDILQECIRADIAAVNEYKKVIDHPEYLFDSRGIIRKQLHSLQKTLNTIKKMEDIVE
jgi:uncharacterized protein (TIGR02284 family)